MTTTRGRLVAAVVTVAATTTCVSVGRAQESPCTARPRWIAVTVVASYTFRPGVNLPPEVRNLLSPGQPEEVTFPPGLAAEAARRGVMGADAAMDEGRTGVQLLDRCDGDELHVHQPNLDQSRAAAAVDEGARTELMFISSTVTWIFVRETIQEMRRDGRLRRRYGGLVRAEQAVTGR